MSGRNVITILLVATFITAGLALAKRLTHETIKVDAKHAKQLDVNLAFGAGELRIYPEDIKEAAILDVDYDERKYSYDVNYDVTKRTGELKIECVRDHNEKIDTDNNQCDITFSTRYPMTMDLQCGAAKADIDFGGLPIEKMQIQIGAAAAEIGFSEINPVRMENFAINAGASSLKMYHLGNANFDNMEFDGGVGSYTLDFRGDFTGEANIKIKVGLGSMDIVLPQNIPVRVETESSKWLSSVELHHNNLNEMDDGIYESDDFKQAKTRITLSLEVGLGSIDVDWQK